MRALSEIRTDDRYDAARMACESCKEAHGDRIDELEKANLALLDEVAGLIGDIERVSKERDEWRERYAELVEVTATRTDQAALARS
jgi:hypothetical protein